MKDVIFAIFALTLILAGMTYYSSKQDKINNEKWNYCWTLGSISGVPFEGRQDFTRDCFER